MEPRQRPAGEDRMTGTIRALRAHRLVGPEALALDEIAPPGPGPGDLLVAVEAAGVNLADVAAVMGARRPPPAVPFIPGLEGAGVVLAAGENVRDWKTGDRLCGFFPSGSLAQQALAPANLCVPLPRRIGSDVAASLPFAHAGALMALRDRAHLAEGETLLVLGAGGHLGLAAVAVGKLLGARVIAAASGEERGAGAGQQGADEVIDTAAKPLGEAVRLLTGGLGVNVVFDPVGGDAFLPALGAIASGGRYVVAGFAGGQPGEINPAVLFARDAQLMTSNVMQALSHAPMRALSALASVVTWAAEEKLSPRIAAKFPLKDARHAIEYVRAHRATGAAIVTM